MTVERHVHDDIVTDLFLKEQKGIDFTSLEFTDYVQMGRELMNKVECYQARIAFYALKICTIRHGGRSDKFYTLKDYARALNMNSKTLQGWTLAYRNVVAKIDIPLEKIDAKTWKAVNRTNDNMSWANRRDNIENGTPRRAQKYKHQMDNEKVKKAFKEELENVDEPSFVSELRSWMHSCRAMKNNLLKRDLSLAHEGDLLELQRMLIDSSNTISNYLKGKKK